MPTSALDHCHTRTRIGFSRKNIYSELNLIATGATALIRKAAERDFFTSERLFAPCAHQTTPQLSSLYNEDLMSTDPHPRVCVDRLLSRLEHQLKAEELAIQENPRNAVTGGPTGGMTKLALSSRRCWASGRTLRVHFLEGSPQLHERVAAVARQWTEHANLRLEFLPVGSRGAADAEIRVAFGSNGDRGSWSFIGTDCRTVVPGAPTMNFGWLTPASSDQQVQAVVLHEFGHALGCIHEHSSPAVAIPWNKPAVYAAYAGAPNYWTKEKVDFQVFERYAVDQTQFSAFDPSSIMLYPIPKELTDGVFEIGWNTSLSTTDRAFIGHIYS